MKIQTAILLSVAFLSLTAGAQKKGDNTVIVKGVGFLEVCNRLLDAGYVIEKKDNELQTVKTELREYPKTWNAYYSISVRIKDSSALISGFITAPHKTGGLFKDDQVTYTTNKKGVPHGKGLFNVAFFMLDDFAKSIGREVSYARF